MKEFAKNHWLTILLILVIIVLIVYPMLFMTTGKAARIVYEHSSGVKWDAGYLKERAKALKAKKSSFKYKKKEYSTETGKAMV